MSGTSFLAPLRFISLLLNLIVISEVFPFTVCNDEPQNPACEQDYDAQQIRIPAACMVALTCFEIFGLITGISIFNDIHNLFSSGFNLLSMFLILFYQMDNWSPNSLWWIFGLFNVPPFIGELVIIIRTLVYRKF